MDIRNKIQSLHDYEAFAEFIFMIHALREEVIGEMHEANTDKIQQLSGRIVSYDQILQMADLPKLRKMYRDSLT